MNDHYRLEYYPGLGCSLFAVVEQTDHLLAGVGTHHDWTPIQCLEYARTKGFSLVSSTVENKIRIDRIFEK